MHKRLLILPLLALALAACGGDDDGDGGGQAAEPASTGPAGTAAEETPAESGTEADEERRPRRQGEALRVGDSQFGRILLDRRGQALYLFDKERTRRSECYGDCARAWPPFITRGRPRGIRGADPDLVGTTRRRDGKLQVTYAGQPLYYYVDDSPGNVLCHNVNEFGGLWLVVRPDGNPVS